MITDLRFLNACNRCHSDKSTDWALNLCADWYGTKMERPSRQRALLIDAARKSHAAAVPGLLGMLATNDIAYWRAVAGRLLESWLSDATVRTSLCQSLKDTNALVRAESVRALEPAIAEQGVADALKSSLGDPSRAVRLAAAWALRDKLEPSEKVTAELEECLALNADQPAGQGIEFGDAA